MHFTKIQWKNLFAYGEQIQTIDYGNEGKLILLKGQSGAGKSAILSLPCLLLYGKLEKVSKTAIANRVNKNGWLQGTIIKGQHTYVIERKFQPNGLTVFKDGVNIENYGTRDAQAYIDQEIIEMPQATFTNMISISMKKFKSFLTMSPADRKQIIDRVFSLEVINIVFEKIKKDMRELGASINADNSTVYSLNQTVQNANTELIRLQEKNMTEDNKEKIEENKKKIEQANSNLQRLNEAYQKAYQEQQKISNDIQLLKGQELKTSMLVKQYIDKLTLFSQDKCPTCGSSFSTAEFDQLRKDINDKKVEQEQLKKQLSEKIIDLSNNIVQYNDYLQKIQNAVLQNNSLINQMTNENNIITEKLKNSAEYTAIERIITQTTEQIQTIQDNLAEKTQKLEDLSTLSVVYSIEGVKQKVINNYLPLLNKEIESNLSLLNFPYQLEFDSKFEPKLTDIGAPVPPETLSDGEMTRVDLVVLCSLFKLLKRKYQSINILSIDELISFLDTENSQLLLGYMKQFAAAMKLNVYVVSHVNIDTEYFDVCMEVTRGDNGFSKIKEENLMV